MSYKNKHKTIDLFAGCGGLLDGFQETGLYETVASVEWKTEPYENLKHRLSTKWGYDNTDDIVMRFDIQRTDELFRGWSNDEAYGTNNGLDVPVNKSGGVEIIIGGPPCQAYSIAGRIRDANGMKDDYRNYLFESYLRVVREYQPKIVVFENVQGLLSACPGGVPVIDRIRAAFEYAGYELIENISHKAVIDFSDYGVPQSRRRVVLVGLNRTAFPGDRQTILELFYDLLLPKYKVSKKNTVFHGISDLPRLMPTKQDYRIDGRKYSHSPHVTSVLNHRPRYHNRRDMDIFGELAHDIATGQNKYVATDVLKELYSERTGKSSNVHKYYVLRWDQPSNTIPAHLVKDGLRHIHPDHTQARSITVREAARLQTFSDDYVFISSQGENYRMIGNAVPPLFAKKLAMALDELLTGRYRELLEHDKVLQTN